MAAGGSRAGVVGRAMASTGKVGEGRSPLELLASRFGVV